MTNLVCGCGGARFRGEQGTEHDEGYGDCPECAVWIAERNEAEWQRLEDKVAAALNETNRAKFRAYELGVRRGILISMMERGIIEFTIRG